MTVMVVNNNIIKRFYVIRFYFNTLNVVFPNQHLARLKPKDKSLIIIPEYSRRDRLCHTPP